ncbi:Uncharacterised protein [Pseudomonas fluorescens]|uniref:Uncharacterized protein n=1 Tax=Pseudomonas fluorescens TaxID=294 RepID=A0A3S5E9J0_PSEFL|nr:hypothetical protein [Pseudomonas fluorescens]VEF10845.1 Uncharacterised protein [Pseudomonas fluorescens]
MAEKALDFSMHELIVALLIERKISTGFWGVRMHFDVYGSNIASAKEPKAKLPGMAVAVTGLTLVPLTKEEEGSVDASMVNPEEKPITKNDPEQILH